MRTLVADLSGFHIREDETAGKISFFPAFFFAAATQNQENKRS
jgi:hypothetical protein